MVLLVECVSIININNAEEGLVLKILTVFLVFNQFNVDGVYQIPSVMKQELRLNFVMSIHGITDSLIIINSIFVILSFSLKIFRVLILFSLFISKDLGSSLLLSLLKLMLKPIKLEIN